MIFFKFNLYQGSFVQPTDDVMRENHFKYVCRSSRNQTLSYVVCVCVLIVYRDCTCTFVVFPIRILL